MKRWVLRDDPWARVEPLLPGKATDGGLSAKDNRLFIEAVVWLCQTGASWPDVPEERGSGHTTYVRFWR